MKYQVKFSCGHIQTVELFGAESDRQRKIEYFETRCQCEECETKAITQKYDEKVVKYSEYKTIFSNCPTKKDSYDKTNKTIVILVEKQEQEEKVKQSKIEEEKVMKVIAEKEAEIETLTADETKRAEIRNVIENTKKAILENLPKVTGSTLSEKLEQISTFASLSDKYITSFIKMIAKKV